MKPANAVMLADGTWPYPAGTDDFCHEVELVVAIGRGGRDIDPARVEPTTSADFVRPAPRPAYSVLSTAKWDAAGLPAMPHWRDALHEAIETLAEELTDDL